MWHELNLMTIIQKTIIYREIAAKELNSRTAALFAEDHRQAQHDRTQPAAAEDTRNGQMETTTTTMMIMTWRGTHLE